MRVFRGVDEFMGLSICVNPDDQVLFHRVDSWEVPSSIEIQNKGKDANHFPQMPTKMPSIFSIGQ